MPNITVFLDDETYRRARIWQPTAAPLNGAFDPTPPPLLPQPHEHKQVTGKTTHLAAFHPSKQRT